MLSALCLGGVKLLSRLQVTLAQDSPWRESHTLILAHGDDITLEVTEACVPLALVDGEWRKTMLVGIVVRFHDDPGWRVGHAEIQNLALHDEGVGSSHDLLDTSGEVPPK